jgi:CO/xanthine dehydrogenase Mo-binding subunit
MVTVYSGKVDLGTGVQTALGQIVAEELDVPFRNVNVVQGDTALTPDQGPTFGSVSIQVGGVQIRNAAAMARNALVELAATRLSVKADELTIADGVVSGGGKQVSYGELIAGKTFSLTLDHQKPPATKDAKAFKIVRYFGPSSRHSGQGHWQIRLHAGLPCAWHAAWARRTAARYRSPAPKRRRKIDRRHTRERADCT